MRAPEFYGSGKPPAGFDLMRQAEEFGAGAFDVQAYQKAITEQDISKFPFVADPESYDSIEGLSIEVSDDPFLPAKYGGLWSRRSIAR